MTPEDAATATEGPAPEEEAAAPADAAGGPGAPATDAPVGGSPAPEPALSDPALSEPALSAESWHLVSVVDVRMDLPAANPEVVLQESTAPWRELRIPVGLAEGNAIAHALHGVGTARPLSHALFAEILERQGVEIEAARITARQGRLFAAELETTGPRGRQIVACRPSDAIALLLRRRMPTPLLVGDWVFDNAAGDAG